MKQKKKHPTYTGRLGSWLLSSLLLTSLSLSGQQVILLPLQPQTELIIFDQVFQVNILNPTDQLVSGFLEIELVDDQGQIPIRMVSPLLHLLPGVTLNSNEILWGSTIEVGRRQFISAIAETNMLPGGRYTLCYRFRSQNDQAILGVRCQEQHTRSFGRSELLAPVDESILSSFFPILTWKPPLPLISTQVQYEVKLVQVQQGQSPAIALRRNFPLIQRSKLSNTVLPYPVDAYPLQAGREYAWQVQASYQGIPLGATSIWTFRVQEEEHQHRQSQSEESYRFVKPKIGANYYVANETLRFAYDNRFGEAQLNYEIFEDDAPRNRLQNLPVVTLQEGVNTIDLEGEQIPELEAHQGYVLSIQDQAGKTFYFKFKYWKSE